MVVSGPAGPERAPAFLRRNGRGAVQPRCNGPHPSCVHLVSNMSKGRAAGGGEGVQYGIVGIVVVVILVIVVLQFL